MVVKKTERENNQLKEQQQGWQEDLQALLGRMEESNRFTLSRRGRVILSFLYTHKL